MACSLTYSYKCNECHQVQDINIQTSDIMDKYGRVEQDKLSMRMYEPRQCECGGELKKIINHIASPLWFEMGIGKGKISQRFK
jgi:predicted nucleic acid-binding Zn ribbon protein